MIRRLALVVFLALMATTSFAQHPSFSKLAKKQSNQFLTRYTLVKPHFDLDYKKAEYSGSMLFESKKSIPLIDYNTSFFCRVEHRLSLSTNIPIKMRLGDLDYVNFLEGKNNNLRIFEP